MTEKLMSATRATLGLQCESKNVALRLSQAVCLETQLREVEKPENKDPRKKGSVVEGVF